MNIAESVFKSIQATASFPPGSIPKKSGVKRASQQIHVWECPSLKAARILAGKGYCPSVLNFASAKSPGGGFLRGAIAQEEYLARSSGLYACLKGHEMYSYHRALKTPIYSDYAIYTPGVPVFRGENSELLDNPFNVAFISCAAVNAGRVKQDYGDQVELEMRKRIYKILSISCHYRHDSIVLGAWGCGAFQNNPRDVAAWFKEILSHKFRDAFEKVVFAIIDESEEQGCLSAFENVFGEKDVK